MSIFSYHLVKLPFFMFIKSMCLNSVKRKTDGLIHSEFMTVMTLGSPIFSPSRILFGQMSVFMQWENENSLDNYLEQDSFGKILAKGWHVRLLFIRDWGKFSGFKIPDHPVNVVASNSPVVAVTLAKMKPFSIPRFIHWGRPVEKLVRDHPGKTLALASIKFPNTVSTFSIWKSDKEMSNMVHGHSLVDNPTRHADAVKERERKDFHFEFITLRFQPTAEFGSWHGKSNYIFI